MTKCQLEGRTARKLRLVVDRNPQLDGIYVNVSWLEAPKLNSWAKKLALYGNQYWANFLKVESYFDRTFLSSKVQSNK